MSFVMPAAAAAPMLWGERSDLHPKRMLYALSLDVSARLAGSHFQIEPRAAALRHLFDQAVAIMPDGARCDLPVAALVGGSGRIGLDNDPLSPRLTMNLSANLGAAGPLLIECSGVVTFTGGPLAFTNIGLGPALGTQQLGGTAFIATRQQTPGPTYRWLNRRQLWGVGRVALRADSGERKLSFTFDMYAAA
jgi:hypothetical protein